MSEEPLQEPQQYAGRNGEPETDMSQEASEEPEQKPMSALEMLMQMKEQKSEDE